MVGHFVRLKLRLLANRLRAGSVVGMIGFVLVWLVSVLAGVGAGLAVFGLGRLIEDPLLPLILAYTLAFAGWMVIPAAVSALDQTLDPRRFELLPITPRQLTVGLLMAGAVGPGGVATLVGLAVATFASFPGWSLAPILVVVVIIELVLCLLVARLITTVFASLLASRRAREILTLAIGLLAGSVALTTVILDESDGSPPGFDVEISSLEGLAMLGWTPPGALARSASLMATGEIVAGLGMLLYGLATAVLIGWGWARSMRRMMVTAPTVGRRARRQGGRPRTLALTPDWLRLRSGPTAAMVAKELRYVFRDNRVRSQLLGSAVPVVVIAFLSANSLDGGAYTPFLAAAVAFLLVFTILGNQFGMDGGSFWGYVVAPLPLAHVVKGKNLGWSLIVAGPVLLIALGLAVWVGDFSYLLAALFASASVLLVALSVGNVTSIYGAFPIPESNPFGNRGFSGEVFVAVMLSMLASGALLVPLIALVGLPAALLNPIWTTIAALFGIPYAILVYRLVMRLTSRLLVERQQKLLDVIDGERGRA